MEPWPVPSGKVRNKCGDACGESLEKLNKSTEDGTSGRATNNGDGSFSSVAITLMEGSTGERKRDGGDSEETREPNSSSGLLARDAVTENSPPMWTFVYSKDNQNKCSTEVEGLSADSLLRNAESKGKRKRKRGSDGTFLDSSLQKEASEEERRRESNEELWQLLSMINTNRSENFCKNEDYGSKLRRSRGRPRSGSRSQSQSRSDVWLHNLFEDRINEMSNRNIGDSNEFDILTKKKKVPTATLR